MKEETGLDVDVGPVVEVLDRVQRADDGRVEYHYVIIDYCAAVRGGSLACASDADAAGGWVAATEVSAYGVDAGREARGRESAGVGPMNRDAAWALLTEWTQSDSLRKHALAVEAAGARLRPPGRRDEEDWGVVALLHDFDYER